MAHLLLNFVTICMIGCYISVAETCDISGLVNCAEQLGTESNELHDGVIPSDTAIRHMCSFLDTYKTCVDSKYCNVDEVELAIKVIKDVLGFMCGDSMEGILNNTECWIKPSLKDGQHQCMVTHNQTVKDINRQLYTRSKKVTYGKMCDVMHHTTYCMSNVARKECGTEPSHIMHKLMDATFKQAYNLLPDCSPSGTATLMYSYALCFMTLVMYMMLLFV